MALDHINPVWSVTTPTSWPLAPNPMSVSSLLDIETCPRRWALIQADYPSIWESRGYPNRVNGASISGKVTHLSIEIITKALVKAGCFSGDNPLFSTVLRGLGGYSKVINDSINLIINREVGNPRFECSRRFISQSLRGHVSDLREQVKALLGRQLSPQLGQRPAAEAKTYSHFVGLGKGIHSEVRIAPEGMGWVGVADLVKIDDAECEIIDFKTGEPRPEHEFQVRVYALLWARDEKLNPRALPASRLTLAYPNRNVSVPAPNENELETLYREIHDRSRTVADMLLTDPPPAKPDAGACHFCSVRHNCDVYWKESTQKFFSCASGHEKLASIEYIDSEVNIVRRRGPTTWDGIIATPGRLPVGAKIVINSGNTDTVFHTILATSRKVRIIDGRLSALSEDDSGTHLITLNQLSEVFACRSTSALSL